MVGFGYSERPEKPDYSLRHVGRPDPRGDGRAGHREGAPGGQQLRWRHRAAAGHQAPGPGGQAGADGQHGCPTSRSPRGSTTSGASTARFEHMKSVMGYFAYDRVLTSGDLAQARFEGATQPGFQESFSSMFPAPRQRWVESMTVADDEIRSLPHRTLIVHGREDQVIPLETSLKLLQLLDNADLSVFSHCGHWSMIERRDDFNRQVRDFFLEQLKPRTIGAGGTATMQPRPKATGHERLARGPRPRAAAPHLRGHGPHPGRRGPHGGHVPRRRPARLALHRALARGDLGRGGLVPAARRLHGADPPRPRRAPVARHGAVAGDGELHGQGDLADRRPRRDAALRPAGPGHLQPAQPHPGELPGRHRDGVRREVPRRGQGVPGVLRRRVDLAGRLPRVADDRRACRSCRTCSSSRTTSTPTRRRCG